MSDTDNSSGAAAPARESIWQRLRNRFGRNRDMGLRESLEGAIESHEAQNPGETVGREAKSMMLNIIEFSSLRVDDVMVPRVDIVAIDETDSMQDLLEKFIDANHSRVPVYRETLDGVTGMIHVKDFLRWIASRGTRKKRSTKADKADKVEKPEKDLLSGLTIAASALATPVKQAGLNREVLFVPPSMPATDLLVRMQASHTHLAIVIDEYGGTEGLVSIEDLVEVIVGDIEDEHDVGEAATIEKLENGDFLLDARADLDEVTEELGVDFRLEDTPAEVTTIGGLVAWLAGRVPMRGEIIPTPVEAYEFEIIEADPRRVGKLRVRGRRRP